MPKMFLEKYFRSFGTKIKKCSIENLCYKRLLLIADRKNGGQIQI